jgi:hypothetical protein
VGGPTPCAAVGWAPTSSAGTRSHARRRLMLVALTFGRLALTIVPDRKSGGFPTRPWWHTGGGGPSAPWQQEPAPRAPTIQATKGGRVESSVRLGRIAGVRSESAGVGWSSPSC